MKNHFLSLTALVFLHLLFWIHHVPAQKLTKSYTTDYKKINITKHTSSGTPGPPLALAPHGIPLAPMGAPCVGPSDPISSQR